VRVCRFIREARSRKCGPPAVIWFFDNLDKRNSSN